MLFLGNLLYEIKRSTLALIRSYNVVMVAKLTLLTIQLLDNCKSVLKSKVLSRSKKAILIGILIQSAILLCAVAI